MDDQAGQQAHCQTSQQLGITLGGLEDVGLHGKDDGKVAGHDGATAYA